MNCHFKIPNGMSAGQIPDGIARQKQDHTRLARGFAQMLEGALLVSRQTVFQKVDIIGHQIFLLSPSLNSNLQLLRQVTHAVTLRPLIARIAKQYINTNCAEWLAVHGFALKTVTLPRQRGACENLFTVASHRKPVIVRKLSRDWYAGYVGSDFGQKAAELEILDMSGRVLQLAWDQIKWVCYVRDLAATSSAGETGNPERLLHKRFAVRPRAAGLWMRLTLVDGDEIEGLAANDRSLIEGAGLLLTPPDTRSNTQRIYVPRSSIQVLEILGLDIVARIGRHCRPPGPRPARSCFPCLLRHRIVIPGSVQSQG